MYQCKLCGCEIPDKRGLPFQFWAGRSIHPERERIRDMNDLPEVCWDICDVHLDKFAKWHWHRSDKKPQEDDVVSWVEDQIKIVASRMQKGLPGGYCQCFVYDGHHKCPNWADGFIGSIPACKQHIKLAQKGRKLISSPYEQPIKAAAMSLLNI